MKRWTKLQSSKNTSAIQQKSKSSTYLSSLVSPFFICIKLQCNMCDIDKHFSPSTPRHTHTNPVYTKSLSFVPFYRFIWNTMENYMRHTKAHKYTDTSVNDYSRSSSSMKEKNSAMSFIYISSSFIRSPVFSALLFCHKIALCSFIVL